MRLNRASSWRAAAGPDRKILMIQEDNERAHSSWNTSAWAMVLGVQRMREVSLETLHKQSPAGIHWQMRPKRMHDQLGLHRVHKSVQGCALFFEARSGIVIRHISDDGGSINTRAHADPFSRWRLPY